MLLSISITLTETIQLQVVRTCLFLKQAIDFLKIWIRTPITGFRRKNPTTSLNKIKKKELLRSVNCQIIV